MLELAKIPSPFKRAKFLFLIISPLMHIGQTPSVTTSCRIMQKECTIPMLCLEKLAGH